MSIINQNILSLDHFTILFFYSDGSVLQEMQQVEKHVKELMPAVDFLKINVRTNPKVSTSFYVDTTPAVLIFQNGKEIWRQVSNFSENELQSHLAEMSRQNK